MQTEDDKWGEPTASVSFGIRSRVLSAAQITARLNLQPTRCWSKGDRRESRSGNHVVADATVWRLESTSVGSDIGDSVRWIVNQLVPRRGALSALRGQADSMLLWILLHPTDAATAVACSGDSFAALAGVVDQVTIAIADFGTVSGEHLPQDQRPRPHADAGDRRRHGDD